MTNEQSEHVMRELNALYCRSLSEDYDSFITAATLNAAQAMVRRLQWASPPVCTKYFGEIHLEYRNGGAGQYARVKIYVTASGTYRFDISSNGTIPEKHDIPQVLERAIRELTNVKEIECNDTP